MEPNTFIVIPAKDEADRIGQVLTGVKEAGYEQIVVVNDGSIDATVEIARKNGAHVLTHAVNLGAGAATKTGIEFALELGAELIVTIDGDGQHFPTDIDRLVQPFLKERELDVVIGSRFKQRNEDIPVQRVIYNKIGNLLTALITGILVSDSQSGLKAFRARFARHLDFQFSGYEFCTEFIHLMRQHRARYKEVPINVRYTFETMKKGQSLENGFKMVLQFIRQFG